MIWFISSSIPKQYDLAYYLNCDQHGKLWNLIQYGNNFWQWYLISLTWQVHHSKFYFYGLCSTSRDRLCLSPIPQHEELSLSLWCVTNWYEPIWKRPLHKAMLILCYEDHIDYFAEDFRVRYVNIHRRIQSRFNSFLLLQKILLLIWLYCITVCPVEFSQQNVTITLRSDKLHWFFTYYSALGEHRWRGHPNTAWIVTKIISRGPKIFLMEFPGCVYTYAGATCHTHGMTWNCFPQYWSFARGVPFHGSSVDSSHKKTVIWSSGVFLTNWRCSWFETTRRWCEVTAMGLIESSNNYTDKCWSFIHSSTHISMRWRYIAMTS